MIKKFKINEDLVKIIISFILFVFSFFIKDYKIFYLIVLILSYLIVSYEVFIDAFKNALKGEIFDENLLMIIATVGAFFINEYQEAIIVMLLFELGEYISDLAVDNSKKSITELMDLRSDYVYLKVNNKIKKVDIKDVKLDSIFVVKPGEKVPLDGVIVDGNTNIDSSSLTGESIPKHVKIGDSVLSGTLNVDSVIEVKATSEFETSTASKIIDIIEKSNDKKTNTEKFITRFSKIYTPIVVLLSILITLIPVILGYEFNDWIYKSLEFLVISCPCALVVSVPLGFFCGIGRASKEGILIKGSNELDHLSKIKAIVFDKTGTITHGNFEVNKVCNTKGVEKDKLLEIAAYCEFYSNHPIAKAIIKKYDKDIDKNKIKDFNEKSGYGVSCKINKDKYIVGSFKYLSENNIKAQVHNNEIGTVIYIAKNNEYLGHILITDIIKKEAYDLVEQLSLVGIDKVTMLSGDDIEIVKKVGNEVKINDYYSNLLPNEKVEKLNEIKKENFTAFVGDGINDAPVIKLSDIGYSMGGIGSDAAIEASDVVLMKDDLSNIVKSIKISKMCKKIITFNIVFALVFKVLILILSFLGITNMLMAVFSDVGVTLLSVLNVLRIMKKKI